MTRGRCGRLPLHRKTLSFSTLHRSNGAQEAAVGLQPAHDQRALVERIKRDLIARGGELQKQVDALRREAAHEFAKDVVRPVAEEWDEREEFPWPVVQEAAKIGLYGFDFMAQAMMGDPTGLTMPVAMEELFWGDAGIGLAMRYPCPSSQPS